MSDLPTEKSALQGLRQFLQSKDPPIELGSGWTAQVIPRKHVDKTSSGPRADVYYFAPDGTRFRSKKEVLVHLSPESAGDNKGQDKTPSGAQKLPAKKNDKQDALGGKTGNFKRRAQHEEVESRILDGTCGENVRKVRRKVYQPGDQKDAETQVCDADFPPE